MQVRRLIQGIALLFSASALGAGLTACGSEQAAELGSVRTTQQQQGTPGSAQALFVVGAATTLSSSDSALKGRLESLGYQAIVVDDDATSNGDAQNKILVVISESVSSAALGSKFKDVDVPVLSMEPAGWGHLDIAPSDASWGDTVGDSDDQVELQIYADGHLSPAFPGTTVRTTFYPETYVWAHPSSSDARIVATLSGHAEKAAIFGYVEGAAIEDGARAPQRRVGFFAGRDAAQLFTDQAWSLFDSAVRWATFQTPQNAALLVVADVPLSITDLAAMERLEDLGLGVEIATDGTVSSADANGMRLVAISESVASADVNTKFRDVKVPVVSWEPAIWDDMNMAGPSDPWGTNIGGESGQTVLSISGNHPLHAGLAGTVAATVNAQTYSWARPSSSHAIVAARIASDPSKVALFGFERGAPMQYGFPAPHRRVAFFGGPGTFGALSPDGWRLFDAAITWAIAPQALLVVDQQGDAAPADDAALKLRLEALGYHVRVMDGGTVQATDAVGMNLIVISESTVSGEVGTKFRNVAVPVVNMEVALQDELGMTGTSGQGIAPGQTNVNIVSSSHDLAAGLSGTVTVIGAARDMSFGSPTSSADVIATITGNPSQATIYGYTSGDAMVGLTAPAARVFLFPSRLTPSALLDSGWALFEAAVRWATGTVAPQHQLAFLEQPSGALGVSLAVHAHTVQVTYSVNGGAEVTETLVQSGNTFAATLASGATFSAGDVVRARVNILSSTLGPSAFTQIYTVVGSYITLAAVGRDTPILAYNSSNPIVVAGDESSEYLYATFTSPLTAAEKSHMQAQGAHFDALVTQTEDLQAYRITALSAVNVLASALQSVSSKFHNLTPLKLQEKITRADEPKTQGNAKLVSLRCGIQVSAASCQATLHTQLTSVEHSYARNVLGYATESQIQALAALSALASGHEVPLSLEAMAEARVATYVEVLHESLTPPYDPSQSRSGGGILVGIYDSGVDPGHPDFFDLSSIPAALRQESGSAWHPPENTLASLPEFPPYFSHHGTHVAGIAAGNGSHSGGNNASRGVAVASTLFTAPSEYVNVFGHGNVINHSNISNKVGYYTTADAEEDRALHQPWLYQDGIYKTFVAAAGNNGTENRRQSYQQAYYSLLSEAKNAIIVGNYDDGTGIINPSSSMGPTRDGRLKPDLVAPGTDILAATLFSPDYRNEAPAPHTYEELSGTSMAAPHVAGIATLLHQAQRDRTPGCTGNHDLCPAYEYQALRNATVKAALIQTAHDLTYSQSQAQADQVLDNADLSKGEGAPAFTFYGIGPDYSTGWGLVDGLSARILVSEERYRQEFDLRQGEERRFSLEVPTAGNSVPRVTIAWDDAPSLGFTSGSNTVAFEAGKRLVNDIDMYLIDPLGRAHYPWRIPQPMAQAFPLPPDGDDNITFAAIQGTQAVRSSLISPPSQDPGHFDHVNNVERVDANSGLSGTWTVVVLGRNITDTQGFSIAHNAISLIPEEEIELVYRARTYNVSGPANQSFWREWRTGGDDHLAGSETDEALMTGFVLDTRGPEKGTLQLQARIKFLASGLESDWTDWANEGEVLMGDAFHPFWPITQMEFRAVFPHIGTTYYDIEYQVLDEASGWGPWVCGGTTVGDPGTAILGVRMRLRSSLTVPACP